jgi:NADPH-dependent 2,4-dienoyl-CoA reductase/sulfur reductase-like enzyme
MTEQYDVLVVGAGPAGLAAAAAATRSGARVGLIDEQARGGGQVWRHDLAHVASRRARVALRALASNLRIEHLAGLRVVAAPDSHHLVAEDAKSVRQLAFDRLVLATGARELLLPFPGWTLPGVTGAGGLQALVKNGWPIARRRVVVAGSGPLLLAAAATLRTHGAQVVAIVEQASLAQIAAFATRLPRWPGKFVQALALKARLANVPYRMGSIVRAAHGATRLEAIEIDDGRRRSHVPCDALACGFGLVPNVELAAALGCALDESVRHPHVVVDRWQRSSLEHVYAVGEACGVGGVDCAHIEGAIAGFAATGSEQAARSLFARRAHARRFAALLTEHFALDARVRTLTTADTLVCRCEDVPFRAITDFSDARSAKLATRCGMGACQGRICGTALRELKRWPRDFGRPPIFPARLDTLALASSGIPFPPLHETTS